jgi:hypothetical protein
VFILLPPDIIHLIASFLNAKELRIASLSIPSSFSSSTHCFNKRCILSNEVLWKDLCTRTNLALEKGYNCWKV